MNFCTISLDIINMLSLLVLLEKCTKFNILNGLELDEMGQRIDDLEKNIAELMTQAGVEEK